MKPMIELCWQCQQNSALIQWSLYTSEEDKSEALQKALYSPCTSCSCSSNETHTMPYISRGGRTVVRSKFLCEGVVAPPIPHCNALPHIGQVKYTIYSFNYAQQVHYPSNPLQPGATTIPSSISCMSLLLTWVTTESTTCMITSGSFAQKSTKTWSSCPPPKSTQRSQSKRRKK